MRRVHILTTGGTMEKRYIEQNGEMRNTEPQIDRCLKLLRLPELEITVKQLMNKDSLDMTDADRTCIAGHVADAAAQGLPVLVTHGTDTVVETGKVVAAHLPDLQTSVVFTGAMTPFGIEGSDAMQNLTEALLATQLVRPGVYLSFHGEVFPIAQVRKDREHSRFLRTP
ncbi:asparaginase domain-containing protein [Terriglobus sp.]|uniref:asparaginase domain-containing protein n=1 Tax=Terriglobus sp. TaxID=1889013 RepID=UPI003B00FDBC